MKLTPSPLPTNIPVTSPLIHALQTFVRVQNRLQVTFGRWLSWGVLSLVLLSASVVILRYGFNMGSIALQETALYNHALIFMLGFAYTLQQNEHVRVDIFYGQTSPKRQAIIDLVGSLIFALPVMIFIAWASWGYIASSWAILETSVESSGLPYVYLLKTIILVMTGLMSFQIISNIIQSGLFLKGLGNPIQPEEVIEKVGKV